MSSRRCRRIALLILVALPLSGCGSGLKLAPVSGRISWNGQPVTQGEIRFTPDDGPPAIGLIAADGTYQLTTLEPNDGALVGRHKVTIMATKVGPGSLAPASFEEEFEQAKVGKILVPGAITWLVPEKYSQPQTSDLSAEVADGSNTINFPLAAEKRLGP